ncbi:MAG: hypothetical protein AAGI38_22145 [Bacteroidota bacterium]
MITLIEKAVSENGLSGRFYVLADGGSKSGHIYLTEDQYNFLASEKLLEFYQEPDDKRED